MYSVIVTTHFWASHQITLPDGSLEPVHSHNWSASAEIVSDRLDSIGMVIDFLVVKKQLDKIVANISGDRMLEKGLFLKNNTTAEVVTKYIYDELEKKIPTGRTLLSVSVSEAPGCIAKFSK